MLDKCMADMARLIADSSRAKMLTVLMDGRAFTAGELAAYANISAQTASNHLKKLLVANMVSCKKIGKYRCYKIYSADIAKYIEALGILSTAEVNWQPRGHDTLDPDLCAARSCYNHMAGKLGVNIVDAMKKNNILSINDDSVELTAQGVKFFMSIGIDANKLIGKDKTLVKTCIDFSERKYHVAGALGQALLNYFLDNRLVLRSKSKPRVLHLTSKGKVWLRDKLGIR